MSFKHLNGAGIYGSKSLKLWDQTTVQNDFQSIATVVVPAAGQANITFSNIPQNFTHLHLRISARSDNASGTDACSIYMQLGNAGTIDSSGSHYSQHQYTAYTGAGNGWQAGGSGSLNASYIGLATSAGQGANIFGANIIDILDYSNTSKFKTMRSQFGVETNSSSYWNYTGVDTGSWQSNNAITDIKLYLNDGSARNFTQYSQVALYGIKVSS